MKTVAIRDILTDEESKLAVELKSAKAIHERITRPNIERINEKLGQENDPLYLAYAIEWAVTTAASKISFAG